MSEHAKANGKNGGGGECRKTALRESKQKRPNPGVPAVAHWVKNLTAATQVAAEALV